MNANIRDVPKTEVASADADRRVWLVAILLSFGILIVFGQAIGFEFLMWDDEPFVVPYLQRFHGLSADSVAWAFTNSENGWRTPIPYLVYFAEAEIFGLNPAGYHLTSVLIHTFSTLLLFSVLRRMTRDVWASAVVAALFAIHPLHVEPVAWITGRWDLLCGFFWILGIWFYACYCRRPGILRYIAVMLAYICAIMSKPMALTFPFALLLLDYWPLRRIFVPAQETIAVAQGLAYESRSWQRIVLEKVPLFAVMLIAFSITYSAKAAYTASQTMISIGWTDRLFNAVQSYANYVWQFVWPTRFSFYYPHPATSGGYSTAALIFSFSLVVAGCVGAAWLGRQRRYLLTGWLWFLGVLVPAIGLFQVAHSARADRYVYVPMIGLCLLAVWGIKDLAAHFQLPTKALVAVAAIVVAVLIPVARVQTSTWKNSWSVYSHGLSIDETNHKALSGLGALALRENNLELAERYYRRNLSAIPERGYHHYVLGKCLYLQNKNDEALQHLRIAVQTTPGLTKARRMLALAIHKSGNHQAALTEARNMIRVRPDDPLAYQWLADFCADTGNYDEAVVNYLKCLERDPANRRVPRSLGTVYLRQGRAEAAIDFYTSYLEKFPWRADVADHLASILAAHPDATPVKAKATTAETTG